MSKRVNSLENNVPPRVSILGDALQGGFFPTGPSTESHADSSKSCGGIEWLLLTDFEHNMASTWSLDGVTLNYQEASEILEFLSVWLGIPPHLSASAQLTTITTMSHDADCPRPFTAQVEIQRQIVHYSTALAGDVDSSTSSSLMNLFSSELDTLYAMYKDIWSTKLELQLLRAKLYLYSHCLNIVWRTSYDRARVSDESTLHSVKMLLHRGFLSAISLVHNSQKLNTTPSDSEPAPSGGILIHHPKFYLQTVMFAVIFLLKFLSNNLNQKFSQRDRELAYSHITIAHQLFSGYSHSLECLRVAGVIEQLVENLNENDNQKCTPVNSKLGASLMYSTLSYLSTPAKAEHSANHTENSGEILEVVNFAASDKPSTSTPMIWDSHDTAQPFETTDAALPDDLSGFQWNSDEFVFDIREF
ncbi:hypothetical protein LTR84_010539 [Exophiala bonariae]|uniref:Transcription factor domain-containing protein n=1 Tax=Exophiala bonariae TaxID=1690606 RepID=A0AAV9MSU2_9EURO|nr:hypothetical protein LTR84_010539 [Exophiala bonariae]